MKIKLYMKLQKTGEVVDKDKETGDFLLKNSKGEVVKVSPLVFQLWDMVSDEKTVKQIVDEYVEFFGFGEYEARKSTKEVLQALVKKSLLSIKA